MVVADASGLVTEAGGREAQVTAVAAGSRADWPCHTKSPGTVPVLDVDGRSNGQFTAAAVYTGLKYRELRGFSVLAADPVRYEISERL